MATEQKRINWKFLSVLPTVSVLAFALFHFIYVKYIHHASKGDTDEGNCYLGVFLRKLVLHLRQRLLVNGSTVISWGH